MRTVAIIQARVGSARLPGKVLSDLRGQPLIWHTVTRVAKCRALDAVVVATGDEPANKPLVDLCHAQGWSVFVGSESDVLQRFHDCATRYLADVIVRITGDCPLVDPACILDVLNYRARHGYDYATNANPPMLPDGLDVEAFTMHALRRAFRNAIRKSDREHVTPWLREHLPPMAWGNLRHEPDLSDYRLCIDEPADLGVMRALFAWGGVGLGWRQAIDYLDKHPELAALNGGIMRNEGYSKSLKEDDV